MDSCGRNQILSNQKNEMEKQNKNSGPEICGDKFIEHATHECVRSGLGDDTLMNI